MISLLMRSMATNLSPIVVNGLRCVFAALTLALVVAFTGKAGALAAVPVSAAGGIVLSGVLGQAIGDAAFVRSAKTIGAARALPLSSSAPLLTLILAALFLGEQVHPANVAGAVLVFAGVILLAIPYGPLLAVRLMDKADRGGLLMALLAAGCYAVSTVILKNALAEMDILVANLIRMTTAALLLTGLELTYTGGKVPLGLTGRVLRVMLLTGILSAFSSTMYVTSVHYAGAAKASILTSTSPLFGLPLALIFLHERINRRIVAGTITSVIGIWLVLWR